MKISRAEEFGSIPTGSPERICVTEFWGADRSPIALESPSLRTGSYLSGPRNWIGVDPR